MSPQPYRHVLVPTDFSPASMVAIDEAIRLATAFDASLTLVHVYDIPAYAYGGVGLTGVDLITPVREAAEQVLTALTSATRERYARVDSVLQTGSAWQGIVATAKAVGADLIVISTHGRTGVAHALLGSVAEKVVQHAPVAVLTVRGNATG